MLAVEIGIVAVDPLDNVLVVFEAALGNPGRRVDAGPLEGHARVVVAEFGGGAGRADIVVEGVLEQGGK